MKKIVLLALSCSLAGVAIAQKSQVKAAEKFLGDKNYESARTAIESAVNDETTKNLARTWYIRSTVYLAIQQEPANEGKDFYKEAGKSLKKLISIQSDYEKEDVNNKLFAVAIYNFNDGLAAFQTSKYDISYVNFGEVVDIFNLENGKRFGTMKGFDTMARQSALYQGYSAYYSKNYDAAIPVLEKAKKDPVVFNHNIYLMLAEMYGLKKADILKFSSNDSLIQFNRDEIIKLTNAQQQTLAEGRKAYPTEKSLMNAELNFYIQSGKFSDLVTKLEDAIKLDPQNAELYFIMGTAYDQMANPKDKDKDLPKPANYNELFAKSETAYKGAIGVDANHADANYNLGALYFNRGVIINEQMNVLADKSSPANDKKYEVLKKERTEWFGKALPYLEKTITIFDPKASSLTGEEKQTYSNALISAMNIYARMNNAEKNKEAKKKLEALK